MPRLPAHEKRRGRVKPQHLPEHVCKRGAMAFPPSYPGQMRPRPALVIQRRRYSDATRKRRKHRVKVSGTGLWAIPLFIARAWSHCISDMAMQVVQAICCIWSLLHLVVPACICVGSTSPPRECVKYCPIGMTTCPVGYTVYDNGVSGSGDFYSGVFCL